MPLDPSTPTISRAITLPLALHQAIILVAGAEWAGDWDAAALMIWRRGVRAWAAEHGRAGEMEATLHAFGPTEAEDEAEDDPPARRV